MELSIAADLTRNKANLIAENALLRRQLIVFNRHVTKLIFSQLDRFWLILLARRVKN